MTKDRKEKCSQKGHFSFLLGKTFQQDVVSYRLQNQKLAEGILFHSCCSGLSLVDLITEVLMSLSFTR